MSTSTKSIQQFEEFISCHQTIAFSMLLIGLPLFTLFVVAISSTLIILPFALLFGWI